MATPQICFTVPTLLLPLYETALAHPGAASFTFLLFAFFPKLPFRFIGLVILLPLLLAVLVWVLFCCVAFNREDRPPATNRDAESGLASRDRQQGQTYGGTATANISTASPGTQNSNQGATPARRDEPSESSSTTPSARDLHEDTALWFCMRLLFAWFAIYFYRLSSPVDIFVKI